MCRKSAWGCSMGMNFEIDGDPSPLRENTCQSFVQAARSGATFVEFDVQVNIYFVDRSLQYLPGRPSQTNLFLNGPFGEPCELLMILGNSQIFGLKLFDGSCYTVPKKHLVLCICTGCFDLPFETLAQCGFIH